MRRLLAAFLIFAMIGCAGRSTVPVHRTPDVEIVETVADDGGPIDIQATDDPPPPPTAAELGAEAGGAALVVAAETGLLESFFDWLFGLILDRPSESVNEY